MSRIGRTEVKQPTDGKQTGTVIFLHGSGATGQLLKEWVELVRRDASFPHLKILYPTAPMRPYTPSMGAKSNVWFDRLELSPNCAEHMDTINPMCDELRKLIDQEVKNGIPLNRIVVGGFSMGGSMSLHLGYRIVPDIAGVFVLSSFLNNNSIVLKEIQEKKEKKLPPLFQAHGDLDDMVALSWGQTTFDTLKNVGVDGEFHIIKHTYHEIKGREIDLLFDWIERIVPDDEL